MFLISRRSDDAVDAAFQEPVGKERERVGDIDRDAARVGTHPFPRLLRRAHLQCRHGLAEEKRHGAEVRVAFYPHPAQLLVHGGLSVVVFHVSQMAVGLLGIAVAFEKVGFWELEDDGE